MEFGTIIWNFGLFLTIKTKIKKMKQHLVTGAVVIVAVLAAIAIDKKLGITAKISGK